jgi:hypothetical protein
VERSLGGIHRATLILHTWATGLMISMHYNGETRFISRHGRELTKRATQRTYNASIDAMLAGLDDAERNPRHPQSPPEEVSKAQGLNTHYRGCPDSVASWLLGAKAARST